MLITIIIMSLTVGDTVHQNGSSPTTVTVRATGIGFPPAKGRAEQKRLMARRAAEVVAVRNLSAKLGPESSRHLPPFRYVSTQEHPNGSVEVTVETEVKIAAKTGTSQPNLKKRVCPPRPVRHAP